MSTLDAPAGGSPIAEELPPQSIPESTVESEPAAAPLVDLRALMMNRFEQWLDQMLVGEPPPRGVPEHLLADATSLNAAAPQRAPGVESDLYTVFSSLTALTGEIRLQGRAFKQLSDVLSPLAQAPLALARLEEAVDALHEQQDTAEHPELSHAQVCAVLIDLYDRLQRGLQTCDDAIESMEAEHTRRGWFARLLGSPVTAPSAVSAVSAIRDASALTLARLQAALQDWEVQRIGQAGEPFDPLRMTAVDVRPAMDVPPGTVLTVQRSGYAVHDQVRATAQVTVSKAIDPAR